MGVSFLKMFSLQLQVYSGKQNIINIPTVYSSISSKGKFNSGMGAYQTIVEGRKREGEWRDRERSSYLIKIGAGV